MKAVTWQGVGDVQVQDVPDPQIEKPTDAVVRITSSGICGSDLHLYQTLGPFMGKGNVLGHEPMGIVQEIGADVSGVAVGDRVVLPFQICCGSCYMCDQGLQTQCETTQVREQGTGAALYGFSRLYGEVPGGQAEYLRTPLVDANAVVVPEGPPDDRFLYLSDVLPTAWQSVEYAGIPDGGSVTVMGAGPIGDMASRIAAHRGHRVITVDLVPERLTRVAAHGAETINLGEVDDLGERIREMTDGRGTDAVIDAVGMEAHGSPGAAFAQRLAGILPDAVAAPLMKTAGVDRLAALYNAVDVVRRGGTISVIGVYGGAADPLPMMTMFDKQIQFRMGQANVRRWVEDILPLLTDEDPLGVDDFATHHLPLSAAEHGYKIFQAKADNACKVVLRP